MVAIFGEITKEENNLTSLEKYPEASAVVLYESGKNTFEQIGDYIRLVKVVHRKIKVLDASRFKGSEVKIDYYKSENTKEKIESIKAFTHNNGIKTAVGAASFFDTDESENWSSKNFAFPDVKDGSIIEYKYRIESPYFFSFGDWEFQGDLPKIYSEFKADIPGNYVYKRSLIGSRELDINENDIKTACFQVEGTSKDADCDSFVYAMYDVSPFKEEPFMLSKRNYMSRLNFEFVEYINFRGERSRYSKSWKDVDKEFKTDKDMGRQVKASKFFKEALPSSLFAIKDSKEKAIAIYKHIQEHYQWNGKYKIFSDVRVKDAYKEGVGNIAEINLSLINALRAADLEVEIGLVSTRNLGFISDVYPVLTGFNYVLAFLKIGKETILLDATDKSLPFGMIPFKALNMRLRVMDFKKGSYWHTIVPELRNVNYYKYVLEMNVEQSIIGTLKEVHSGYEGYNLRKKMVDKGDKFFEREFTNDIEFYDITFTDNRDVNEKPLEINQKITMEFDEKSNQIYFNPLQFHFDFLDNPFKSEERSYPVDLGYPKTNIFELRLKLPEGYELESIPENKKIVFKDGIGLCTIIYKKEAQDLFCSVRYKLSSSHFGSEDYQELRYFLNNIVNEHLKNAVKIKKA